jgi:ethanolamine utilization protein EutA
MSRTVKLVGLDCGSTTSCLVVASGQLTTGALGRVDVTGLEESFRSELVFTPLSQEQGANRQLDTGRLSEYLDAWLAAAEVAPQEILGGGALITGLAAQRENAAAVSAMLSQRLANTVIAAADAPRLESWLAFMGNCHDLSQAHPDTPILNIDLGGGTANLALGLNGQVLATGSLFVGARHFRFEPGSYRLLETSPLAQSLLKALSIRRSIGDELSEHEVAAIVDFYVARLVEVIEGRAPIGEIATGHVQSDFAPPQIDRERMAITLSGGVGQLVYQMRQAQADFARTEFGDLGGELARGILRCDAIVGRLSLVPQGLGRATVLGLLRHSTELSGATLYLPHPERLPLENVPIIGQIDTQCSSDQIVSLLQLAAAAGHAAAIQIDLPQDLAAVRQVGELLATALANNPLPAGLTLVLLLESNLGKALGNYVTRWGKLEVDLIVIDEVPRRDAQFLRLGRPRETVVPLWLYAVR